jgi:non-ribosomal peptide synthetase-like protein
VYVGLLGILKSGAAYVPVDPDYPMERVGTIFEDAGVKVVVTVGDFARRLREGVAEVKGRAVIAVDEMRGELAGMSGARLTQGETGVGPEDTAYVIYTSGSTGRPKGVPITHRSVCHLVRAEGMIFGVRGEDRVFQGFSVAFDASVEEVWLAFFGGATLVPGTAEVVRSGAALAGVLREQRISVLSCVPTLLALVQEDVPTIRLLIFGGEVCPPDLVKRWWRGPGGALAPRRVVNTYGPTEATVIATYAECAAGVPVTIGRALPNYRAYVVTEGMEEAAVGEAGELCLSGVGLSPGYLNRPELTAEKFVRNLFSAERGFERMYRTGDLARVNEAGEIEFLGRMDSQVKLRGFRIELAEIETAMRESDRRVLNAAVAVREDQPGCQRLVGYVVLKDGCAGGWDEKGMKAALRGRLPGYMVPACIEVIGELPTLTSGKVDRKRLPAPKARAAEAVADPPMGELEQKIAAMWARSAGGGGGAEISRSADFFRELGGDSLLVAVFVSRLRAEKGCEDVAVRDVYQHPSVAQLAAAIGARRAVSGTEGPAAEAKGRASRHVPARRWQYRLFCAAQALCLYFVVGFYSLQWLTPYLVYVWMVETGATRVMAIAWALGALLGVYPLMLAGTIFAKWVLVGRMKAGSYPMWGYFHLRWWLLHRILDAVAVEYLEGTPLMSWYFRLMGARIGRNVHFRSYNIGAFDMVTVGDDSCLGNATALLGYTIEEGLLRLGPVTVGERCEVGASSVLRLGTVMEDDSKLLHMSLLAEGTRVPRGETWFGSPARRVCGAVEVMPGAASHRAGGLRRWGFGVLQMVGIFVLPVTYLAALFPGLVLLNELAARYGERWSIVAAPVVAVVFVVLMCVEIFVVKWGLLGRVKAGDYPVASWFFVRKWFVDQLMALSLDILGPLYATLYLNPWYRSLGAKMGRRAEISTACAASPDLLEIGEESFIADAVLLGVPEVRGGGGGRLALQKTRIGSRAFVGNSATVPAGTVIGDKTLIGVLSTPPLEEPGAEQADTTWLGSPAIGLPGRAVSAEFPEEATFKPTRKLIAQRLGIEFARIILPLAGFVALTSVLITTTVELKVYLFTYQQILLFPVFYFLAGVAAAVFTIGIKWLLVGRYRPSTWPLWCTFVWRSELVNALHESLAGAFLMEMLAGTPLLCWYFRLMGMKVGRRVYMDTSEFTEFDLVTVGDDTALNIEATIQTHLFEDRVMKMSGVEIGARCSVGACAVVLYDTKMEDEAVIEELSLVMKGECLPAGTRWHGTPARRAFLIPKPDVTRTGDFTEDRNLQSCRETVSGNL